MPAVKSDLLNYDSGGTRKAFTKAMLDNYEIEAPSYEKQKIIGDFLFLFNRKIESNRRMNQTLEQMAQTLFQQWFVAFKFPAEHNVYTEEKIDKNLAHKLLGGGVKSNKIYDLFNNFTDESEEFCPQPLSELIDFDPKTPVRKNTQTRFLPMTELPTQGFAIGTLGARPYSGGAKFRQGDTLLARITPCLENGKTGFVDFLEEGETAAGSTEFIVMRGKGNVPSEFVYCLARSAEFRTYAIAQMVGSSGRQRVAAQALASYVFPTPNPQTLIAFGEAVQPVFARISANNNQSRTLATLRDTLLPQLLSGRLTVRRAEELVAS